MNDFDTELEVACVVQKLTSLGQRVAPQKTEALWFYRKRGGAVPTRSVIGVRGTAVEIGQHIKYLRLTWTASGALRSILNE